MTYPHRGALDFGPYCGFWPSLWLTRQLTLRDKASALWWGIKWTVKRLASRIGWTSVR